MVRPITKRFLVAIFQSYLFWVIALPLLNQDLIVVAIFPVLAMVVAEKFLPFLAPPFFIALAALGASSLFVWRNHKSYEWWWPLSANAIFLIAFLVSAEAYKSILIYADARPYEPDCIHVHSFLRSVREASEFSPEHANFVKNGVTYFWSYSERKFVLGSTSQERGCPQP